jgi:hypothetical protein
VIATFPLPDPATAPNRFQFTGTVPAGAGDQNVCMLFTAPNDGPYTPLPPATGACPVKRTMKLIALLLLGASSGAMAQAPTDTPLDSGWTVRIDPGRCRRPRRTPRRRAGFPPMCPAASSRT